MSTNLKSEKYIGGEFSAADLAPITLRGTSLSAAIYFPPSIKGLQRSLFESGADSIAFILSTIERQVLIIWVPLNFCFESLQRVQLKLAAKKIMVKTYSSIETIPFSKEHVNILLIVYFNSYDKKLSEFAAPLQGEVITIEDFTHAPLDINKTKGTYSFCSLRKFVPVSVSITYANQTPPASLNEKESAYLKLMKAGKEIKKLVSEDPSYGEESVYLTLFELAEAQLRNTKIQKAHQSQTDIFSHIDFDQILQIRTSNYLFLYRALQRSTVVTAILPGVYMYFMIRTNYQQRLRKHFFNHHIFPAIHWHDSDSAISKNILSFHIDHRYDTNDMQRIKHALEAFNVE